MKKNNFLPRMLSVMCGGFFLLLSLGQFERVSLPSWPAFYLHDVVLVMLVGWLATRASFRVWVREHLANNLKKEFLLLLVIVVIGWTGAALRGEFAAAAPLYAARLGLFLAAAASILFLLEKKWLPASALRLSLLMYTAGIAYFGYLQYLFFPDTRVLFFLGWDDHYYRLISTLLDPGFTGILLVIGFLFWQSEVSLLAAVVFLPAILLTYSRASYLSFAVVLVGLILLKLQARQLSQAIMIFFLVLMSAFGILLLPRPGGEGVNLQRTASIDARKTTFLQSFQEMSPAGYVFGKGLFLPNTRRSSYDTEYHAQQSDSWLATILTGVGVLGSIIIGLIVVRYLHFDWRKYQVFFLAILAILLHGLFNASVFYPFVLLPVLGWWVLLTQRSSRSASSR